MSNPQQILQSLLRCPSCGGNVDSSAAAGDIACLGCDNRYFRLGDTVCMFPAGLNQRVLWEHQAGNMRARGEQGLAYLREAMSRYDLSTATRQRLFDNFQALALSQETTLAILADVGIHAQVHEPLEQMRSADLTEYWDLILRDWAWDRCDNSSYKGDENSAALGRILQVAKGLPAPSTMLVLGAGAGRLSWDLHCQMGAEATVALDSNPVMLSVADRLIKQQKSIEVGEFKIFPQIDRAATKLWAIPPVSDPEGKRESWFALAGDAWHMPLQPGRFDVVVTPWFIDVNGGDVRDTIALISRLLKPGGYWLNTGPLLFSRDLPLQIKYQDLEIKEFLNLSGFKMVAEQVDETNHLASELEVRRQHEQLWTFCTQAPAAPGPVASVAGVEAPWLVMHHLPIPMDSYSSPQQHPLVDAILGLIDGERSVNDICWALAPELPEGMAPKDVVVTLLGQILEATLEKRAEDQK